MNNNVSDDQFNILEENNVSMRLVALYNQSILFLNSTHPM